MKKGKIRKGDKMRNAIEALKENEAMGEFWAVLDEVVPGWAKGEWLGEHAELWREMVRREWLLFTRLCESCRLSLLAWGRKRKRKEPSKSERKLNEFLRGRDLLDPTFLIECDTVSLARYVPSGMKIENSEEMQEETKESESYWRLIVQIKEEIPLDEEKRIYTTRGVVTKETKVVLRNFHICTVPREPKVKELFEMMCDSWARLKALLWHRERWSEQDEAKTLADEVLERARKAIEEKAKKAINKRYAEIERKKEEKVEAIEKKPETPTETTSTERRILPFRRRRSIL